MRLYTLELGSFEKVDANIRPSKPCTVVARHISLTSCNLLSRTREASALIQYSSAFSSHHNLTFGSCVFRFSAQRLWNSLPVSIRVSQSVPTFRRHLKTFYFQSAYPLQLPTLPRISSSTLPDSSKSLALYKSFIYLLTYSLCIRIFEYLRVRDIMFYKLNKIK